MATEEEKKIARLQELKAIYEKEGLAFDGELVGHEVRDIWREMTTAELLDARERYAKLNGNIQDLESQKKCDAQYYDGQIKPLRTQSEQLLSDIRSKMHQIKDDCYIMNDYEANKVRYVSRVTLQVVEVREMTGADRQRSIDFQEEENQEQDAPENQS